MKELVTREVPVEVLTATEKKLLRMAAKARRHAYAPYSEYRVGAALIDENGKIHTGCNVENSSFSAGICAERVAIGKMVSRGGTRAVHVAVVTSSDKPAMPCGVCRQVLFELARDAKVISGNSRATVARRSTVSELFPQGFGVEELVNREGDRRR